ncbi:MAG TPA: hypothetical protein VI837_01520 [Blastocatellia bacterium]|nr:hypothetical protein [Blastocatellia bacterium]
MTRRILWRVRWIALVIGLIILILVAWVEVSHRINYGHFVSYGLHTDTLSRRADIGIPGVEMLYATETFNFTLLSFSAQGCQAPTDLSPFYEMIYRYQVQRFDPVSGEWVKVIGVDPSDCEPLMTRRIWPGQSIRTVDWEATGARKGLQKGDTARFVVFTALNKVDEAADQRILSSPSFTIEDQVADPSVSYRVKH